MERLILALFTLGAPGAALASTPPSLGAYADEAVRNNPEIRALRAGYQAQLARIPRAGAPPDPMLMVEWSMFPLRYPVSLSRTEMTGIEVGIQQEIPFPGKLRFAEEAEMHAARALASRVLEAERTLRSAVAQAYFELAYLHQARELIAKNEKLLDHLGRHAEAQVATGRGLRQDVLRARTESAMLKERIYSLDAQLRAAEARFNYLLARPITQPVAPPPLPGPPPPLPPLSSLLARAEGARPLLRARDSELARADAELARARRDQYPNFLVGASYRFRAGPEHDAVQGSDFYSLRFGLTLPVWHRSKQSKAVREAHALRWARREEYEAELNRVRYDVRRLYEAVAKERRTLPLYTDLLAPLSRESLKAAVSPYVTGQIDFHSVLQSWTRLLETDLERIRALVAVHARSAELEAAVGASLAPNAGRRPR
jgi:cobalt-zinc-cadmium efflux system outer membrane protein